MEDVPGATASRLFLNSHGIKICRPCHNSIHDAEREEVLAEQLNTLGRVLSHPKIVRTAKYNSTQRVRGKLAPN